MLLPTILNGGTMRKFAARSVAALGYCLLAASFISCQQNDLPDGLYARMKTNKGDILIKLDYEHAPLTVCNFVGLAEGKLDATKGKPFYDGLSFHRVVPDFVVQGGDPQGDGSGGPGYSFADEFSNSLKHDSGGVLSMANAGPNTNGSQFFITLKEAPWLDGVHSAFGRVTEGMDVVKKIAQGDKIDKIEIVRSGVAAKAFRVDQASWNALEEKAAAAATKRVADKREADLATIAKNWPDLKADADGIFQRVLKAGSGALPASGSTVSVSYKGSFLDGKVFDASDLHGGAIEFRVGVGEIIPGWDKVVSSMRKGERRFIVLPPELAYGERGAGGVIQPNTFLAFELELVDIKK
jgi:peptidylprolyl isomerase